MGREALQVVVNRDAGWRTGVETREVAVFERYRVVVSNELHQHGRDQHDKISSVTEVILLGYYAYGWRIGTCSLCR